MSKFLRVVPIALALAAAMSTGVAHARDGHVQWSVTIAAPIYLPPPVYALPTPVYRAPAPVRYYGAPAYWDRDGDGIPNRYDVRYNPRWDHDGDGVPNRYDRHDHNPWRR
jgi:hypothetical protein